MDLFSTTALNRVVEETPVVRTAFFLNSYFTEFETSETEDIKFDKRPKGRRLITPLVSPLVRGRIIREQGFKTASVSPAYLKDKRVFEPSRYFKRTVGEKIGGSLSPEQRLAASVGFAVDEQLQMWVGRLEQMAAETIRTGKIILESADYEKNEVDFGRDPDHSVVLTGADKWDSPTSDPLDDIEEWGQMIFIASGASANDVLMAADVWKTLRARMAEKDSNGDPTPFAAKCKLQLDMTLASLTLAKAEFGPMVIREGVRLVALFGEYRLWIHSDKYQDPETGEEVDLLPAGEVVMAARGAVEGVRHFGAIKDFKANLRPIPFFVKSWEEDTDVSVRYIMGQSAPLLVPYRPNATLGAKVK